MSTRALIVGAALGVAVLSGCAIVPTPIGPAVVPAPLVIRGGGQHAPAYGAPGYRAPGAYGGYGAYGGHGGYGYQGGNRGYGYRGYGGYGR